MDQNKYSGKKVVIVGAGFGGLFCAKGLAGTDAHVTLIDKQNHHLFQPLLYQVATGFLGINDVALPIRSLFKRDKNVDVVMEEVHSIDAKGQKVTTGRHSYNYDYLVLATGAQYHFFGRDEWKANSGVLKSLNDAIGLRQRILASFEKAELETDEAERAKLLTYVVIGGGPTGVEMAGAIADVINYALKLEFRNIRPEHTTIMLIEAAPRILNTMSEEVSRYAREMLEKKGVKVKCQTTVKDILKGEVVTADDNIKSNIVLWAAGVRATPLAGWLGIEPDKRGAVVVNENLEVPSLPNVFILGDAATFMEKGKPLPAVASVAKQQGKYLAKFLRKKFKDKNYKKPFRYCNLGTMATIGRNAAVADFGNFTMKGWLAWMAWGAVHIYFLSGFRNRITVFLNWLWTYITFGMSARIILRAKSDSEK